MRQRRVRGGRLPGLVRRWRPDGNPLRRTADRVEAAVVAALIAAFLAGAPLAALAAGRSASVTGSRIEHAQAGWHQVAAVLLHSASATSHPMFQVSLESLVPARWTAPDGTPRTGEIYAPAGAKAGSTVTVWADRSGRLTPIPLQRGDVVEEVALAASLATMAVAAVLAAIGLLARWVLDRRRLAAWDAHWKATGPQWTGRQ
jgi:hypothetical protein